VCQFASAPDISGSSKIRDYRVTNATVNLTKEGMARVTGLMATAVALVSAASPMDNGRAYKPPMGWRSWNQLGASTTQEDMIVQMGGIASRSRLVNGVPTSLKDLGYTDVGLDDFWQKCGSYGPNQYTYHNAEGTPVINSGKVRPRSGILCNPQKCSGHRIYPQNPPAVPRHD
jgi:hypothetical protein